MNRDEATLHRQVLQSFYEYLEAVERWEQSEFKNRLAYTNLKGALERLAGLSKSRKQEVMRIMGEQAKVKSPEQRAEHIRRMANARQHSSRGSGRGKTFEE